ncbi:hypothetical protein V8D89_004845 [Ganoderma adspersum]
MRLLDTRTLRFVEVNDPKALIYAILSHTWNSLGEQSFQAVSEIQRTHPSDTISSSPALSSKVRDFCAFARNAGYDYCWIDSCCIDKTSSSELTEAINSMYAWYGAADVCYAYLADVSSSPATWEGEFLASRWHRRTWTLQELIAPKNLVFLSCDWLVLGSKAALAPLVEDATGISTAVLMLEEPLSAVPVARRMSWAASRETTRAEDRAYSLFGIFNVQLPTIYGEGGERAFVRLQEEILRNIPDQSIFAWGLRPLPNHGALRVLRESHRSLRVPRGSQAGSFSVTRQHRLLASSPRDFEGSRNVECVPYTELRAALRLESSSLPSLDLSIYSFPFNPPICPVQSVSDSGPTHVAILACKDPTRGLVVLLLRGQLDSSNHFSIGASVPLAPTHPGDTQLDYAHRTYINDTQVAVLRADVFLSTLEHLGSQTVFSLFGVTPVQLLLIALAGGGRDTAFWPTSIVASWVSFLGMVIFSWLDDKLKKSDPTTFRDAKGKECMTLYLFRQVPVLCLVVSAIAITAYVLSAIERADTLERAYEPFLILLTGLSDCVALIILFLSVHIRHTVY